MAQNLLKAGINMIRRLVMEKYSYAQIFLTLDPLEIKRVGKSSVQVVSSQIRLNAALGPTNRVMIAHDLSGAHY